MSRPSRFAVHLTLLILANPASFPLLWMLSTSLKADDQVYSGAGGGGFSLANLIPHPAVWSNYPKALSTVPFDVYLRNTVLLCVICVIGAVLSSACVAYGFARINFRCRGPL